MQISEAPISTIQGLMKFEIKYCGIAKDSPQTSTETDNRSAERAIGDGCGVGDQRQAGSGKRRKAEPDQHRRGDGDWRAKAGCTLEEGPEGKGDQQQLQSPIRGHPADRLLHM